jgi:hypothetical protein
VSAHQLRRVGNRGVWIDPTDVVAVAPYRSEVAVLLAAGGRVVVHVVDAMKVATDADVHAIVDVLRAPIQDPDDHAPPAWLGAADDPDLEAPEAEVPSQA